ncbi:MAG TPA: hypothetical protein VFB27_05265 [Opitutaceae bacterium]|nr:hypothetical protein [Opitutaceae bacterium]
MSFMPFIVIPLIGGLVIWSAWIQKRKAAANLQKLAAQLGLEFLPARGWLARPSVAGTRRGKVVQIFNYTTGSGKSQTTWSAARVQLAAPGPLTFKLKKRGVASKLTALFGARDISVGDADFDRAWFVQTNQPEFLCAALLPELREKLMAARRAGASGAFELTGAEVKYAEIGSFATAKRTDRFATLIDLLGDLADVADVAAEQNQA